MIQRIYRGFRDRLMLKRLRVRKCLSTRVREHLDRFICSGNFWRMMVDIDTDYRRFQYEINEEATETKTFMAMVIEKRKKDDDQLMQVRLWCDIIYFKSLLLILL